MGARRPPRRAPAPPRRSPAPGRSQGIFGAIGSAAIAAAKDKGREPSFSGIRPDRRGGFDRRQPTGKNKDSRPVFRRSTPNRQRDQKFAEFLALMRKRRGL